MTLAVEEFEELYELIGELCDGAIDARLLRSGSPGWAGRSLNVQRSGSTCATWTSTARCTAGCASRKRRPGRMISAE